MATARAPAPNLKQAAHRATVAAGFVRGLLAGVRRPADRERMLAAAGLSRAALARDARVPIGQYVALYNVVSDSLDDEAFGLLRAPLRRGTFEFLCRAMLGSRDLGEALDRAARFLRVVLPDLAVEVRREGEAAHLQIRETRRLRTRRDDPARVFAFEWLLRLLHGLACWFAGRALPLGEVRFPYPRPPHHADYALIYTERSRFGAPHLEATFEAAFLSLPVRRDAADLAAFLEGAPGKISLLYRRDREAARSVRELLAEDLRIARTLEDAARRLHTSARTLHRRLRQEQTSFREVREALRRERATDLLSRPGASVAGVAAALGYSEPSAFFRAFRGWTGVNPSDFRRRQRETVAK